MTLYMHSSAQITRSAGRGSARTACPAVRAVSAIPPGRTVREAIEKSENLAFGVQDSFRDGRTP
jgi:hypothetical protein